MKQKSYTQVCYTQVNMVTLHENIRSCRLYAHTLISSGYARFIVQALSIHFNTTQLAIQVDIHKHKLAIYSTTVSFY